MTDLPLDELSPAVLWSHLEVPTRELAAGALYDREWDDRASRAEADMAIATTLRFRTQTVRQLPLAKRVDYLTRVVRPDDSLAGSLLMALHLMRRRPLLAAFLDELGIPQDNGLIDSEHEFEPPDREALARAADHVHERFPADEVRVYLATLLAIDPEHWTGLTEVLARSAD